MERCERMFVFIGIFLEISKMLKFKHADSRVAKFDVDAAKIWPSPVDQSYAPKNFRTESNKI